MRELAILDELVQYFGENLPEPTTAALDSEIRKLQRAMKRKERSFRRQQQQQQPQPQPQPSNKVVHTQATRTGLGEVRDDSRLVPGQKIYVSNEKDGYYRPAQYMGHINGLYICVPQGCSIDGTILPDVWRYAEYELQDPEERHVYAYFPKDADGNITFVDQRTVPLTAAKWCNLIASGQVAPIMQMRRD